MLKNICRTEMNKKSNGCRKSLITYRHITAYNVKSARCSEFGAHFNVVHILQKEKTDTLMKETMKMLYRHKKTHNINNNKKVNSLNTIYLLSLWEFFSWHSLHKSLGI